MARQKSEAPVAARAQLDTLDAEQGSGDTQRDRLEEQAKDQEQLQQEELSKKPSPGAKELGKLADEAPAAQRAGITQNAATQGGFMDQLSRRNSVEAIEGHYVEIDLSHDGVKEAYKQAGLYDEDAADDDDNPSDGFGAGGFGVYLTRGATDPETGIPTEILVQLRDDSHARVTVPYEAARQVAAQGRR